MSANTQDLDINSLIESVSVQIDELLKKSESEVASALGKKEESSKEESSKEDSKMAKKEESKKEESSKEDSKLEKDEEEASGHANMAPEAEGNHDMGADGEMAEADDQADSLEAMVKDLDDEMLQELKQVVDMELEGRSGQQEMPAEGEHEEAPAPEMAPEQQMAMKSEIEGLKEKLSKSEDSAQKLEKAFESLTAMMTKLVQKPVVKSVTDIKTVEHIDKGEKSLEKSEAKKLNDAELATEARKIAADNKKLASLSKRERDSLTDFLLNKNSKDEVLKIINK